MRILDSLIVPKNVKGALWVFPTSIQFPNIKKQLKGGPLETLKKFEKSLTKPKTGRGKSNSAEKLERGSFWVLYFKLEAFGCVQKQVLRYFW